MPITKMHTMTDTMTDMHTDDIDSRTKMLRNGATGDGQVVTESQQTENDYLDVDVDNLQKMSDFKSYSKGLMDIALLSANANQLRTVLEYPYEHKWPLVGMITLSLVLQVLATCLLILERMTCSKKDYKRCHYYNAAIAISVVLIIFINIFITAFGVPDLEPVPGPHDGPNGGGGAVMAAADDVKFTSDN